MGQCFCRVNAKIMVMANSGTGNVFAVIMFDGVCNE